jgi:FtsH-binding integral membrane protein
MVLVAGVVLLASGIFTLLLGIFSVRASNDFSKIGPAYVFAIIDLVVSILGVIGNFIGTMNVSSLLEGIVGVVFAACIFWAARTIRDNA